MHPFWLWVVMAMELSRGIELNRYSYFCCHGLQLLNCKEVSSEHFSLFSAISLIFDLDQNRCFYC